MHCQILRNNVIFSILSGVELESELVKFCLWPNICIRQPQHCFVFFFILAPPKNEDLPDLDMLMGTLEGGESELETTASPPPLVLPEEKHAKQRRIEELKQGLANEPIDLYDEDFEKRMEEEVLMIGNISLEMVQVQLE